MLRLQVAAVALLVVAPIVAQATPGKATQFEDGIQMVPRATAPTKRTANGSLYIDSADSNALHYVKPDGTDAAVGGGGGGITASSTDTLTNKTISGSSNTLSNIGNASLVNSGFTLAVPGIFSGGGTTSLGGTLTLTLNSQGANTFFMGPSSGGSATPAFRGIAAADVSAVVPLLTDWFVTPVVEANASITTFDGVAQKPGGTAFMCMRACSVTGVRLAYPNATSKTIKASLWNDAGSRLANASATYSSAGIKTLSFGSSTSLTPGKRYHVSLYETGGTTSIGYLIGSSAFPMAMGNSNTDAPTGGSPVVVWLAWGEDAGGGAGDVFPGNSGSGGEIYPVDPIVTVP